jgi:putative ABC transport system permease protein
MGFAAALSAVAGVSFGAVAALRAARADLNSIIKGGARSVASTASRGTLGALVIVEVALALVLMTAAGVMLDAFRERHGRDLGVRPEGVVTMRLDLTAARYESADARRAFVARLLERVRALPQTEAAGATTSNPFCCGNWGMRVTPEGFAAATAEDTPMVQHFIVTPGYFEAMGQPVLKGRAFTEGDAPGSEMSVIVDATFADRFWPGQDPVGKRVKRGTLDQSYPWLTVVGVVAPVVEQGEFYSESWYLPHAQHADNPAAAETHVMVRASADPTVLGPIVRSIAAEIDPNLALYEMAMLDDLIAQNLRQDRLGAWVTTTFAGAGLLLAALGLYGVLSFVVGQDTKEIGIRRALGAPKGAGLGLVLARALRLTAAGLAAGTLASWVAAQAFTSLVDDVTLNPAIIAGSAAVLLAVALLAALGPARRALRLDPLDALRAD